MEDSTPGFFCQATVRDSIQTRPHARLRGHGGLSGLQAALLQHKLANTTCYAKECEKHVDPDHGRVRVLAAGICFNTATRVRE